MNTLTIKVGKFPGTLTEVVAPAGSTVEELFRLAGVELGDESEYRLDSEPVTLSTTVNSGSLLTVTKRIKGNC